MINELLCVVKQLTKAYLPFPVSPFIYHFLQLCGY